MALLYGDLWALLQGSHPSFLLKRSVYALRTFPNGKNLCISTFYRVRTLREENFNEFSNYFKILASKKKIDRHVLIGDMNLNNVKWPSGETNNSLKNLFVDFLVSDLGHKQLISEPTHRAGNVLDLVFTNIPEIVLDIKVHERDEACLSDHFSISFKIDLSISRRKAPKKKVYNYSKANWRELNFALRHINWDRLIGCLDPQSAWDCFQKILNNLCETHIPKRNVKNQFQPPWYDKECNKVLREKEKWRKKARESGSESDLDKFQQCRKSFKRIMNEKMRLNMEDSSDNSIISKKFWKHVKSKCKYTRIPETMKFGDQFRYKPIDHANLFNTYFFSQFSDRSSYDIEIDLRNDNYEFNKLSFHAVDVLLILKQINSSKAAGPDGIEGILLKYCAASLAKPLTIIFNTSFISGIIPQEWKLASVVPVHKKGDKDNVKNYRPISLISLVMKVLNVASKGSFFRYASSCLILGNTDL